MVLTDSILIDAARSTVFRFFEDMERHYLGWHPDHVLFRGERGRGASEGAVFYFEETIAGKLLKKRVAFTKVLPDAHLEFAPMFWLMRLFLPCMLFRVDPQGGDCHFVAEVHLRMGPIGAWLHRKELDALREHVRVAGLNIKRIVEAQTKRPS